MPSDKSCRSCRLFLRRGPAARRSDARRFRHRARERAERAGPGHGGDMLARMADHIDPRVDIGHVHLKVADLDRALAFYQGVLGFDVTQRFADTAAFLSAGAYHHHIGLNTWESRGGSAPPPNTTGLYHFAIRYPDRAALGDALR